MMEEIKKPNETAVLTSERLVLRPFEPSDAESVYEYAGDPDVTKYLMFKTHENVEESRETIINILANPASFIITLKESGEGLGSISLMVNKTNNKAELGYALAKKHWGKGYCSEAAGLIIDFGFDVLELNRIFAVHALENPGSGGVMKKNGMIYEGLERKSYKLQGQYYDMDRYAILKSDWDDAKGR